MLSHQTFLDLLTPSPRSASCLDAYLCVLVKTSLYVLLFSFLFRCFGAVVEENVREHVVHSMVESIVEC